MRGPGAHVAEPTGQTERPIGTDVEAAAEIVREQHSVITGILRGYDWRSVLFSGSSRARLDATLGVINYLCDPIRAENLRGRGEPDLVQRFNKAERGLLRAFAMCATQPGIQGLRDDIQFFDSIRVWLAKVDADDRSARGLPSTPDVELALRQLASEAVAAGKAIDIFAEAGLSPPDLTNLDEASAERLRTSPHPNLAIEALRIALEQQIRRTHPHNVVAQDRFSKRLIDAMRKYTNNALTAAEIIAELMEVARSVNADTERARELGLTEDELAFYDAVATNGSAKRILGDAVLAAITRDLVRAIRADVTVDWTIREQVQAKLRSKVKRLLAKYGYPPDAEPRATELVLEQTKTFAEEWAA
jgi:type I restriction enzyme R subunit